MKVIIAGSRSITDPQILNDAIDASGWRYEISEVVCGMARGADMLGYDWAVYHGIPVAKFPADWYTLGKAAGLIRNDQMAQYADALIALWDGKSNGTAHMRAAMAKLNKPVLLSILNQ